MSSSAAAFFLLFLDGLGVSVAESSPDASASRACLPLAPCSDFDEAFFFAAAPGKRAIQSDRCIGKKSESRIPLPLPLDGVDLVSLLDHQDGVRAGQCDIDVGVFVELDLQDRLEVLIGHAEREFAVLHACDLAADVKRLGSRRCSLLGGAAGLAAGRRRGRPAALQSTAEGISAKRTTQSPGVSFRLRPKGSSRALGNCADRPLLIIG